jgi:hypothetical protein
VAAAEPPLDPFTFLPDRLKVFEDGVLVVNQLVAMKGVSEFRRALDALSLADLRGSVIAAVARQHQLAMDDGAFDAWLKQPVLDLPDSAFRENPDDLSTFDANIRLVDNFFAMPNLATLIRAVWRAKFDTLKIAVFMTITAQLHERLGPTEFEAWMQR